MDKKIIIKNRGIIENVLFCSLCYSAAWIQGNITSQVSEATHSIETITVDIQMGPS